MDFVTSYSPSESRRTRLRQMAWPMLLLAFAFTVPVQADEFFEKQVRPLLVQRCYQCHGGKKASGGLSLETASGWRKGGESGPAIVPGKVAESLLIDAINYRSLKMPPPDKGGKLSADEIAVLTRWVASGAKDPRQGTRSLGGMSFEQAQSWWAFKPLPRVVPGEMPQSIDGMVNKQLARHGLQPNGSTDKRTLIRRATYDLTGLPPRPSEVEAFLSDDSPEAFDRVVTRLLDSSQYGVHWGRHWLDVVRYADTAGENTDRPLPHAWRYRNWVLEAFNRDMPFDSFARQQLAGDILGAGGTVQQRQEGIVATGYLAIARRFGHDIDKDIHLMHEDVIDNLGKNFLGLTLGCARCHDHKYDPVTSDDYYALYGIFSSTRFAFPGCEPKGQPRDLVPLLSQPEVDARKAAYAKRLREYEQGSPADQEGTQRLKQAAAKASRLLAQSLVGEGKTVSLHDDRQGGLDRIAMRKGEVIQLVVLPNASHGADTTRVEWLIERHEGDRAQWSVADLIDQLTRGGPSIMQADATWCFLDVTDGPTFLREKKLNVAGQKSLSAWASGDTPSVTVNASADPVSVWTTLPGKTFFMHPGPKRDVAVAWVCPQDGVYRIRGLVADGHPAGGDGVTFRLEHVASASYGQGLIALGKRAIRPVQPRPEMPGLPVAYAVAEGESKDARLHERGDPEQLADAIPRRWLTVFGGERVDPDQGSGRRSLADWVVSQPIFARVMVNRLWQWHFGEGLVGTPNDFGFRGEAPVNRELLDWLAAQFRLNGYRLKPMHRLIMRSAAYQRSSRATAIQRERDPQNSWLGRFSRRRLSAEELRDSLLVASGKIDLSFGEAHPFPPTAGWKFSQHAPFNAVYDTARRSAFLMVQRQRRHPYLALFDGADPNSSTPARQVTTVPTQALYFLNDPFFHEQASLAAARIRKQDPVPQRIDQMFRQLFQREPLAGEREIGSRFLGSYPGSEDEKWAAYARVLMASNEFIYLD